MEEPMTHYIPQAFIHSNDAAHDEEKGGVNISLRIDRVSVSNEQFGKLMDILERAAAEAKAVIGG